MRKILVLATVAIMTAAVAVPAFAATKAVKIGDTFFVKKGTKPTISIKKGDSVKWTWTGKLPHNVTVKSGPVKFHSKTQKKGTYSETIKKAGTYKIFCSIHGPAVQSMTIKVS